MLKRGLYMADGADTFETMPVKCSWCGWYKGAHETACPDVAENKEAAIKDYQRGYRVGRSGLDLSDKENATYRLGWGRGLVGLEEAENGYDPRFD